MVSQFLVVSYDITSTPRRTKVMKTLEGFGARVQYSVFECRLKPHEIDDLRKRLKKLITREDSVRFYFLGAEDVKRIERLGDARTVEERIFILR
ncbi:MAG: CRISPR-associated endonuclease Cas2 [Chloroflexota bacterium]